MSRIIEETKLSEGVTSFQVDIDEKLDPNVTLEERYRQYEALLNGGSEIDVSMIRDSGPAFPRPQDLVAPAIRPVR